MMVNDDDDDDASAFCGSGWYKYFLTFGWWTSFFVNGFPAESANGIVRARRSLERLTNSYHTCTVQYRY